MNRFFGAGNPLWNAMGKIFDVFVLNLLWLLCCLPVFTIGPATAAFFYAMINLVRGEDNYVSKDFFHSFRQNFKQGILLGILLTLTGAFLLLDISMCYHAGTGIYTFFMVFFAVMLLLWAAITLYSFPLLAKFEKRTRDILIWAFVLSVKHLGRTLLMLAALGLGLWACHLMSGLIFIAFGLVVEFQSMQMLSILKPYLPDNSGKEEWKPLSFLEENMEGEPNGQE